MPTFSIVIPCFNAEATLRATLDSLLAQTFADFEVICVDDGSTDATRDIVLKAQAIDPRVTLARNPGKGPSDARNFGAICLALGDLIAFCDADDQWAPTKLAEMDTLFATTNCDAAYSKIAFFQDHPEDATTISTMPAVDLSISHLLGENPVGTMSNLTIRHDTFVGSGGFSSDIVHNEDLEFLIRVIGYGARIVGIDRVLTYYRRTEGGLSTNLPAMLAGRTVALSTARRFGFQPLAADHAIHMRYLARRALRVGASRTEAFKFAAHGLRFSPSGFFDCPRRGALTLLGALAALVLPLRSRQALFSR
ncbi:MAG TPA: glycosyltransferase family 2 protein [Marivita sp.]|nr:glycosyltransferase family 2 protein [Marivita sp.]